MIKLENVNKYYYSGNEKIHAIKNFNIAFPDKGLVFVLGPSGCGKSTLLNLLGGLDKIDEGRIMIEDRDLNHFSSTSLNNYLNSYLGFVFQEYNILKDLNLYQNISLPLEIQKYPKKQIKQRVKHILKLVELENLEKRKLSELSGGQRQRIAIARALVKNPKMIIADEPTGNLDSETSENIFSLFKTLAKDRLIIIVTHDEESAFKFGERVIQMEDGKIVADSNPELTSETADKLKLVKASVPLLTSIKLSFKNVYKKKFRFLLMTIISALSLAFLSFTIELNGDKLKQNVYTTINNGYHYTDITSKTELPDEYIKSNFYNKYQSHPLPLGSYNKLKELNPNLNIHKYQRVDIDIAHDNYKIARDYYPGTITTIVQYDSHNEYSLIAGRLPKEGTKEILITDYQIDHLSYYSLLPLFANYYDYIGTYIDMTFETNYKIVGIIKTDHAKWIDFYVDGSFNDDDKLNYAFKNDFIMMNAIVLNLEYYDIEKMTMSSTISSSNYMATASLKVNTPMGEIFEGTDVINYDNIILTTIDQQVISFDIWDRNTWPPRRTVTLGNKPKNPDEILIPYILAQQIFGFTYYKNYDQKTLDAWNGVIATMEQYPDLGNPDFDKNLELTITQKGINNKKIVQRFRIVGFTSSNYIQIHESNYNSIFKFLVQDGENLLAELPTSPQKGLALFENAYNNGYILNVWPYQTDIDAYNIDPFINLITKAGLFVFAIFSIGILWTIISIEIVDSKKEIGIFRSIGLSGTKVSFIFVFQSLIVNLIAYLIALRVGQYAIIQFNARIMDELNMINLTMFMPTSRSAIYLLIFLLIITFSALFLPLYKIMSKKIIDVISERDIL